MSPEARAKAEEQTRQLLREVVRFPDGNVRINHFEELEEAVKA